MRRSLNFWFACLLCVPAAAFAQESVVDPGLSTSCAAMSGDYQITFNGQVSYFSHQKYALKLTFVENSRGLILWTNLNWFHPKQNLDIDRMLNISGQTRALSGLSIFDCYVNSAQCLDSAAISLRYVWIANTYAFKATPADRRALYCAIERVRLFSREVQRLTLDRVH